MGGDSPFRYCLVRQSPLLRAVKPHRALLVLLMLFLGAGFTVLGSQGRMGTKVNEGFEDLETDVFFSVSESEWPRPNDDEGPILFRDPAGLVILRRIRGGLASLGYSVSDARPAHGVEAGLHCKLDSRFVVHVILGVSARNSGTVELHLSTYYFRSFVDRLFDRNATSATQRRVAWKSFCAAIHDQLTREVKAASIIWLTEHAARLHWTQKYGEIEGRW